MIFMFYNPFFYKSYHFSYQIPGGVEVMNGRNSNKRNLVWNIRIYQIKNLIIQS
jgi:hypothetical protein